MIPDGATHYYMYPKGEIYYYKIIDGRMHFYCINQWVVSGSHHNFNNLKPL